MDNLTHMAVRARKATKIIAMLPTHLTYPKNQLERDA